jgi:DNA-binding MarR family transcriptional regulator
MNIETPPPDAESALVEARVLAHEIIAGHQRLATLYDAEEAIVPCMATADVEHTPAVDRLGFLLARHGQIMNLRIRQALGVSGLRPRHGAVLLRLADAGATSQQALIEALAIDASTLVAILNSLEGERLVHRRRDPADRRRHIVEITPAGERAVCAVETAIGEVEKEAFADLDDTEKAHLHELLGRIHTRHDDTACEQD